MTTCGFWLVDAESRKTSGWPWDSVARIGKSRRITSGSRRPFRIRPPNSVDRAAAVAGGAVTVIGRSARLAGGLHCLGGVLGRLAEVRTLGHEQCLVRNV